MDFNEFKRKLGALDFEHLQKNSVFEKVIEEIKTRYPKLAAKLDIDAVLKTVHENLTPSEIRHLKSGNKRKDKNSFGEFINEFKAKKAAKKAEVTEPAEEPKVEEEPKVGEPTTEETPAEE